MVLPLLGPSGKNRGRDGKHERTPCQDVLAPIGAAAIPITQDYHRRELAMNADRVALRQSPHSPLHASFAIVVIAALASPCFLTVVKAQQVAAPSSSASQERIRVALQQRQPSPLIVGPMVPIPPDGRGFGILTFLPPDTRGEFVRVRVPIGALGRGVAHSMAATQHRRAERAAREDVARALEEFRRAPTR